MQFADVVPSSIMVLIALRCVGRRNGELGTDFTKGVLGGRQAELVLEERRFGGILVGARQVESLGRINQLLGLLYDVGKVGKHGRKHQRRMAVSMKTSNGYDEHGTANAPRIGGGRKSLCGGANGRCSVCFGAYEARRPGKRIVELLVVVHERDVR